MNRKRPRQLGKKHQGMHAEGRKKAASSAEASPGSRRKNTAAGTGPAPGKPASSRPAASHKGTGKGKGHGPGKPAAGSRGPGAPGGKRFASAGRDSRRDGAARTPEHKPRFASSRDHAERPQLSKSAPRSLTPRPGTASARQAWGHSEPPSRRRLEELLAKHGVTLPATTLDKVWEYHGILRRNNGDLDLTRLIGFETIVQRHYADCLILHKMMKGKWPSPLVDIGTGAGFPGLMIKIASPATEVILSEPRNVRVDYLNNTIAEMGLKDISVFGHKFTSRSFQTPVNGVITRAFEPIGKTLPRLEYSLQVGGLAMFMKGPGVDEELKAPLPANYRLVRDERYRIPATTLDRAFVVFERIA